MADEEPPLSSYPREELVAALLDAARYGDDEDKDLIKQLVDFDTTLINDADAQGRTAVHMCCANGHADILKTLLKCKPDVGKVNTEGSSPLHFAAAKGSEACVKLLLAAGYPPANKNKMGRKPLDECWDKEPRDMYQKVEDLLLLKDPDVDEALKQHESKITADDLKGMDPPPKEGASSSSSSAKPTASSSSAATSSSAKPAAHKPAAKGAGGYSSTPAAPVSPKVEPTPTPVDGDTPMEEAKEEEPVEQVGIMDME